MRSSYCALDTRVRRRLQAVIWFCALLLLAPLPAGAQDICVLSGTDLQTEVEKGTAEIAEAYAKTSGQLSLSGSPKVQRACNWTCSNPSALGFLKHVFAFLQYNCNTTTVPGTRLPTGPGTASQMGLSLTDAKYRDEADKIFRPGSTGVGELMRVPPSLERASQSGDVKKLTDEVDAIPGATWMKFSSTSVENDGQGAARVIIRVPDTKKPPRFEQWIQIAIDKGTGKFGRNVDFLAVQLRSDSTSPTELTPPVVAFRGFSRTATGFVSEGSGSGNMLTKCYSCHPSGVRAVIPAPAGTPAAGGSVAIKPEGTIPLTGPGNITDITNEDTKKLSVFGPRGYTASQNGPLFGPETGLDREEFVFKGLPARPGRAAAPACAVGLSEPRRKAIVDNMNCEKCHDSSTDRGLLNAGTSLATIFHKVVQNTVAPMPPPAVWAENPSLKLSSAERKVLFECLKAEYAELLHIWLTPSP
jgi:hypothetical protein